MKIFRVIYNYKYFFSLESKVTDLTIELSKCKNIEKIEDELNIIKKDIQDIKQKIYNTETITIESSDDDLEIIDLKKLTINNKPEIKKRKKYIPKALKRVVWNKWIGEELGSAKCLCCKVTTINQLSFVCGHILAEKNGGELNLENLKPICSSCNLSMGTENMDDFIKRMKF
tara:strand:+ start:464 stop:979 length:516 start_codon:yes stop_codon:yes gene_type:complete